MCRTPHWPFYNEPFEVNFELSTDSRPSDTGLVRSQGFQLVLHGIRGKSYVTMEFMLDYRRESMDEKRRELSL